MPIQTSRFVSRTIFIRNAHFLRRIRSTSVGRSGAQPYRLIATNFMGLNLKPAVNSVVIFNSNCLSLDKYRSRRTIIVSAATGANTPEGKDKEGGKINKKRLNRKANLGTMIQMLQLRVPMMLRELLPEECVSKDIILRVLPHQLTKLPTIKGYLLYSTALRTLQLGLTSFYLNPHARFHITNIKVDEPTSSMSSDELVNLSLDDNIIENSTPLAASEITGQAISNYTTKVTVKWRTCLGGCPHLKNSGSTTSAKMGSFSFENFDISKMLPGDGTQPSALIHEAQSRLSSSFLRKDHEQQRMKMASSSQAKHLERVITGIFIFELNAENDHIVVLTIDNCDVLESRETDLEGFGFAPQA